MTMIEKMARAMWAAREPGFPAFTRMSWEAGTPQARAATIKLARAALMAIREPDDERVSNAGWVAMAGDWESNDIERHEAPQDDAFTAMIDAILNEGESR